MGAAADVTKAANDEGGATPMLVACNYVELSVCKWLLEVGAAADITKADNGGFTPMRVTSSVPIMHWLVLKGALVDPTSEDEHVVKNIVERDVPSHRRTDLLSWAQDVVARSNSFRNNVVMGTFWPDDSASTAALLRRAFIATGTAAANADLVIASIPEEQRGPLLQQLRPRPALSKLRGSAGPLELIADFLGGVERQRELRNAREFAEALVAIIENAQ